MELMQKGIDLKVTTRDQNSEMLEEFDSPNGKNGPEYVSISSKEAGIYQIDISPLSQDQSPGEYVLGINVIKPKAIT